MGNKDTCINCMAQVPYLCQCTQTNCCRCNGRVCVRCCIRNFPRQIHEPIKTNNNFVCRNCYKEFKTKCTCCDEANDRCTYCCVDFRHSCCIAYKVIFRQPPASPVFVGPPISPEKGEFKYLDRAESSKVLTKELKLNPTGFTKNRFTRYAATEIEVSEIKNAKLLNEVLNRWGCAVVHDSSTGNNGFEINTVPACGNALTEQLQEICETLQKGKAQVSDTCGLHVHVDCRDYGYQEIQQLFRIYKVVEPVLFAAVHAARIRNAYCQPCGNLYYRKFVQGIKPEKQQITEDFTRNVSDTRVIKKALIPALYGTHALSRNYNGKTPNFYAYRRDHYGRVGEERNEMRYSAINLHSYFLRGTIEFRMHHAALDFVEIYGWTKFLVALMDSVARASSSKISQILSVTTTELAGVKELYGVEVSNDINLGLIVLSSLLHPKYVLHLISKIKLMSSVIPIHGPYILPAQLFFNHLTKAGNSMNIEESGLTEV